MPRRRGEQPRSEGPDDPAGGVVCDAIIDKRPRLMVMAKEEVEQGIRATPGVNFNPLRQFNAK